MAAKPIGAGTENWIRDYSTYFWSARAPLEVKFEIEKTMRLLLTRDSTRASQLTYSGSDNPPFIGREVQLRFEAALPTGNWYSLRITAWVPKTWNTEEEFYRYADRSFQYWIYNLQAAASPGVLDTASQELYDAQVRQALDEEAMRATDKEDPAPILALEQEVLTALRSGRSLRTAHHEGGTTISFDGKSFVRSDWGEEESMTVFRTEEEALQNIREFYDWESRKGTFPHRPLELDVWRFIQHELM